MAAIPVKLLLLILIPFLQFFHVPIPEKTLHGFLVSSLVKKWKAVHSGVKESKDAYDSICEVTSPGNQEAWLEIESEAQTRRWEDKTTMDVYDVCADKGKPLFYSGEQFTYW